MVEKPLPIPDKNILDRCALPVFWGAVGYGVNWIFGAFVLAGLAYRSVCERDEVTRQERSAPKSEGMDVLMTPTDRYGVTICLVSRVRMICGVGPKSQHVSRVGQTDAQRRGLVPALGVLR